MKIKHAPPRVCVCAYVQVPLSTKEVPQRWNYRQPVRIFVVPGNWISVLSERNQSSKTTVPSLQPSWSLIFNYTLFLPQERSKYYQLLCFTCRGIIFKWQHLLVFTTEVWWTWNESGYGKESYKAVNDQSSEIVGWKKILSVGMKYYWQYLISPPLSQKQCDLDLTILGPLSHLLGFLVNLLVHSQD